MSPENPISGDNHGPYRRLIGTKRASKSWSRGKARYGGICADRPIPKTPYPRVLFRQDSFLLSCSDKRIYVNFQKG